MKKEKERQDYVLVAPEGGWGYVVAFGKVLVFLSLFGGMQGFALIFNDFLKEIGVGTGIVAMLHSCASGAMSLAGLFSNLLCEKFTKRSVGVAAAFVYSFGSIFQIFARSILPLFVCSALHGVAVGILLPILFSTFNHYFVERRAFITGATQMIVGIGHVVAPLGVEYLMETYGFRGCLAILTAINFHSILGMLVMHPVEWHMKKVPITVDDLEKDVDQEKQNKEEKSFVNNKTNDVHHLKPLLVSRNTKERSTRTSRAGSIVTISDWAGSLVLSEVPELQNKSKNKRNFLRSLLDLGLLKDLVYANIVLGVALSFYADLSFFSFQPLYLFELQYSQVDVSRIIAIGTGADLVSRCVLTAITAFVKIPPRLVFFVAIVLCLIGRYAFFYIYDFWGMVIITAVIGFLKTWVHIPIGLIFADYLPKEKFASGYGLFMFLQGMFTLLMGPLIRYIRDITNSYVAVFHVLNIFMALTAVLWILEYIFTRIRGKPDNTSQVNSSKKG